MKTLPFEAYKLNGAGNIFLFIDSREGGAFHRWESTQKESRVEITRTLCSLNHLAADGLIFLRHHADPSQGLVWDFYNADGSGAEMCGNAARCAGAFAQEISIAPLPFNLETKAGTVSIQMKEDGRWAVAMPAIQERPQQRTLEVNGKSYQGSLVNSGVPHFVLPVSSFDEVDLQVCRSLRTHPDLGPAGANVTLLEGSKAKTYERGVENYTAACGTGAVAAALVMSQGRTGSFQVTMPGGELEVQLGGARPILIGPAFITAKIEIPQETFA